MPMSAACWWLDIYLFLINVLTISIAVLPETIAQAANVGISTDLEAAAAGLGYDSFADAVSAYNAQYGTNYTTESAKEALGQ